ncbi:4870_t:CDS:1, partial [Racocetra persica]
QDISADTKIDIILVSSSVKYKYTRTICDVVNCPIPAGTTTTILVAFKIPQELGNDFQAYPYLYSSITYGCSCYATASVSNCLDWPPLP